METTDTRTAALAAILALRNRATQRGDPHRFLKKGSSPDRSIETDPERPMIHPSLQAHRVKAMIDATVNVRLLRDPPEPLALGPDHVDEAAARPTEAAWPPTERVGPFSSRTAAPRIS